MFTFEVVMIVRVCNAFKLEPIGLRGEGEDQPISHDMSGCCD